MVSKLHLFNYGCKDTKLYVNKQAFLKKNFFCIITFRQKNRKDHDESSNNLTFIMVFFYLRLFLNNSPMIISRKNTRI